MTGARLLATAAALALLLAVGGGARAMQDALAPSDEKDIARRMYVQVVLNEEDQGDMLVLRERGRFLLPPGELARLRLALPAGLPTLLRDGQQHVALDALPGVRVHWDEEALRLNLQAPANLLPTTVLARPSPAMPDERLAPSGAFLNWALDHDSRRRRPGYAVEAGQRLGYWSISSDALSAPDGRPVRLRSSAVRDWPRQQLRLEAGDLRTRAWEFGESLDIAGLAWGRAFELDPWQPRYPTGVLRGESAVPGELEVRVDGRVVRSEPVRPGAFEVRDLALQPGAREVQLVLRDAYGRVRQYEQSWYMSRQLLGAGVRDWQVAAGALRRGLGLRSSDYGPAVSAALLRWGWSDALTLGLAMQAQRGLATAGADATGAIAGLGVLSTTWAARRSHGGQGTASAASWSFESTRVSMGASLRTQRHWPAMPDDGTAAQDSRHWQLWASWHAGPLGSWGVAHGAGRWTAAGSDPAAPQPASRSTTLWVGGPLRPWHASWRASVVRQHDEAGARMQWRLSLVVPLDGGRHAAFDAGRDRAPFGTVQLAQSLPVGTGWGYDLALARSGGQAAGDPAGAAATWLRGSAQWNTPLAIWRVAGEHAGTPAGSTSGLHVSAAGGVAWLGGRPWFGPPLTGPFLLAKVGPVEGIPVEVNGVPVGRSDAGGRLLLTGLRAHANLDIAIDAAQLPMEWTLPQASRRVVLDARGGSVIDFGLEPVRAWTARLVDAGGRPLESTPVDLHAPGWNIQTLTGMDGRLYIEQPPGGPVAGQAGADAATQARGAACEFTLHPAAAATAGLQDLGEIRCRPLQNRSAGPR